MTALATHWQGATALGAVALAAVYLLLRARRTLRRNSDLPPCANCPAAKHKQG